ncbi:hypothetical protein CW740_09325 [Kangiella profundi]|uniref:Uncharacterized protein n=1 Tax=Kangiella profundi TaxID=1561924 RepID=A0A2K9AZY8_9GAMM|nr:hypothetical protein [Kangiella profundi]AUD79429.1 hypothetical protein CW740_09325 [Kangiella profundi]MBD3667366.1 hypothetical protein [Kangiella sp.]GGE98550.1 hypothetical protein GCM10011356_10460 [Kangiella profundi]
MCTLVLSEELKEPARFAKEFEAFWNYQSKDKETYIKQEPIDQQEINDVLKEKAQLDDSLVIAERRQDRSFLDMVKYQHQP